MVMAKCLDGFPDRLKQLMAEREMTREDLGYALGLAYTTICGYVSGSRVPPVQVLIAMADGFEVSLDWLVKGGDDEAEAE